MEDDSGLFPEEEPLDDFPLLEESPLLEDERHELEDPGFDIRSLLQEAEDDADPEHSRPHRGGRSAAAAGMVAAGVLSILSSVKEQDAGADKMKRTAEDRMQASHLRQNLSALDKTREQQGLFIEKMRGELRACRQRQDLTRRQQEATAAEIAAEGQAGNT
ncbi:Cilia- and flagella-associated protein 74 [Saguinus oedipus]|uniref:Cilia- and flagella-associated protein 74 n=1 Tax=Saguinus oedipus TaxID=9490 RepID=A0ABQ9V8E9_SAGOE|nr:Cilia- and flagella-associated protein 74 [Saguinus oedipus]